MAEKRKEPAFTVTDRRSFTEDGELRQIVHQESSRHDTLQQESVDKEKSNENASAESSSSKAAPIVAATSDASAASPLDPNVPPLPTEAEQKAQADAYRKSSDALDSRVELSGRSAKELEMTFERFMASLYMTAMLQLGLMHQQGEKPRLDIIGARQTIDTLALLAEKTKGNLTSMEENFLQNSLYEVRMAYVEVTNALSRPPQPGAATGTTGR